MKVIMGNI